MPVVILVLLATLVPLAILPGVSFHYDTVPRIVVLSLGGALLVLWPSRIGDAIIGLWHQSAGRRLIALTAAQVGWFSLTAVVSTRPWFSWLGNNWRRMGWATILALAIFTVCSAAIFVRRRDAVGSVLRAVSITVLFAGFYGIAQYFDIDPLQNPSGYHAQAGDMVIVRPPGTMGHADYFGWWLAVAGFCALASFRTEKGWWRHIAIMAAGTSAIAIVLTGTRAAMLGGVAGLVAFLVAGRAKAWRRPLAVLLAAVAILTVFYASPPGERLRARVHWVSEEPVGGARPLLWRDSLHMAGAHPLTGTGPETFASAFPAWQSVQLSRLLPDYYHESPHNMALDALTEQGVPGALLALAWLGVAYMAGRKACGQHAAAPALMGAVAASVIAGTFGVATAGPMFATLLAISMLTALSIEGRPVGEARGLIWIRLSAIPLLMFGVALAVSDFALARAAAIPGAELAAAPRERPARIPGAGEDMFWSRHLSAACGCSQVTNACMECMKVSTRAAARATDTADNPAIAWYNLAIFTSAFGDAAGMERSLRTAIRLSPNWFKPHWSLANLLFITGRAAEARNEADRAVLLDAGKDVDVNATRQRAINAR